MSSSEQHRKHLTSSMQLLVVELTTQSESEDKRDSSQRMDASDVGRMDAVISIYRLTHCLSDQRIHDVCGSVWQSVVEGSNTNFKKCVTWIAARLGGCHASGASKEDERCFARWCSALVCCARAAAANENTNGTNGAWKALVVIGTSAAQNRFLAKCIASDEVCICISESLHQSTSALLNSNSCQNFDDKLCWVRFFVGHLKTIVSSNGVWTSEHGSMLLYCVVSIINLMSFSVKTDWQKGQGDKFPKICGVLANIGAVIIDNEANVRSLPFCLNPCCFICSLPMECMLLKTFLFWKSQALDHLALSISNMGEHTSVVCVLLFACLMSSFCVTGIRPIDGSLFTAYQS